jgi:hypothetical protein
MLPLEATGPRPVMLTDEALMTFQLNMVEPPASIADGLAAKAIMLGILPPEYGGMVVPATVIIVEAELWPALLYASRTYVVVVAG